MRDILTDLKALRLHGMASTWAEMLESEGDGSLSVQTTRPVLTRLLEAEHTDRGMRSIAHQMAQARFPAHRDLVGFDFASARVDRLLVDALATLEFTDAAHNVVLIGGPGTGKTHLATALGIHAINRHGKRVCACLCPTLPCYSGWPRRSSPGCDDEPGYRTRPKSSQRNWYEISRRPCWAACCASPSW